jgi:type I restriction enzyme S subunit
MGGEWQTLTVDQIKAKVDRAIAIGPFGSRMKADTYVTSGVPVIRGNNISDTRAFVDEFVYVSEQTADELHACNVFSGDLVFPHRGAIGQVGIIPASETPRFMLSTSLMKLTCDQEIVDPLFVFYFFRSTLGRHALLQHASTVGTPGIGQPLTSLRSIRLPVPSLPEQRAIAHILGTLDDKIELNRRRNQTLEAMARALFQDWFVDFGPVRAKMEGREPYLPAELWRLFPERLDEAGKPAGWDTVRLDDALILQRGFDLPAAERVSGEYPVMAASGINGFHDRYMVRGPGVTTGRSGVLGRVFFVQGDFWPLNTSLWVKEFKRVSPVFAFHLLRGLDFEMFNAGSAVPTLNRNHVHNLPITIPTPEIATEFDAQVVPLMKQQRANDEESKTLAQLRDTLLPKLISGELRVADAEKFVEHVSP